MNLICGINPVLEALAAGTRHFDRLLVVKGLRSRRLSDAIARATRLGIPLRFEMRETLDRFAGGVPHQGVIAVVSAKPVLTLEGLLETTSDPALLVALDGVEDPRNLGAILRSAEAAGADGTLLPERHSAGLSEVVGRASAGAMEHVQVARVGNLVQALETLKSSGVWVIGFDASGTERWDAVDMRQPVCLVLGGEGRGIRRLVREHCDHLVSIPHFGHVSSLNVSVAAGIALYEAVRQRGTVPSAVRPIPAAPAGEPQVIGPHPDDEEHDPGAAPLPASAAPGEDPEGDPETHDPEALPPHVDIHGDEVAWGQGPTILKPVPSLRRRRAPVRRRKSTPRRPSAKSDKGRREGPGSEGKASVDRDARPGGDPKPQPDAGPEKADADRPQKADPAASAKRGRRRRRRKRSGEANKASATPRPPAEKAAEGASPDSGNGDKPAAARRRRRRRRR